jgi:chemotaxis protein methyltransferase CheR
MAGLSSERVARHFRRVGDQWEVTPQVRDRVTTLRHNLLDPLPRQVRACRVVFCRNVLIYLSPDQVRVLLDRIADELDPSTTLVVGAAETIWQYTDRFRAAHVGDTFFYRRRPAAPVVAETATPEVRRTARVVPARRPAVARRRAPAVEPGPVADPEAAALEKAGQEAVAVGDYASAVVAFRKCAYLRPDDPLAHLHLGLALEAQGDQAAATRAFHAARQVLLSAAPDHTPAGLEGYAAAELLQLLASKG